jgi:2-dehydro-3-deoxyphosphogluconate aldolase/(4S)-4-hydroxy-2-oxoglutarate aldolase
MTALETFNAVRNSGVIGIVRTTSEDLALRQAETVIRAGLPVVEVSLTTPGALRVIEKLARTDNDAIVGVGTVVDEASARSAIDAGGRLLVSPIFNPEVIAVALEHDVAVFPGCLSPTEMVNAMRLGATAVKIFPAHICSPEALAGMLQALPDLPCVPTGGVNPQNAAAWIAAGAIAVGVGSALTAAEDPAPVVEQLTRSIAGARASHV